MYRADTARRRAGTSQLVVTPSDPGTFRGTDEAAASRDDVVVTWFTLDLGAEDLKSCEGVLDPVEQRLADQCTTVVHRNRTIVSFARRRLILSDYCAVAPSELVVRSSPRGKPYAMSRDGEVEFSASRSGDVGVIAVTRYRRVGIDVHVNSEFEASPRLARWLASDDEAARIDALPRSRREEALLLLWTRTEALVKATGDGIGEGVHQVRRLAQIESSDEYFAVAAVRSSWRLHQLATPRRDVVASLVVEGHESDGPINVRSRLLETGRS